MRADRVKIAKEDNVKLRIRFGCVLENLLDHELRPAVGVRAVAGVGGLGERRGLVAINRRGRGENKLLAAELLHDLEHAQRGVEIVAVVGQRQTDGFTDGLEACKVNNACDGLLSENAAQRLLVADVDVIKRRAFTRNFFNAIENLRRAVREIVRQHDLNARVQAGDRRMRPNEPGTAGQ